ncbi:DMT family transporter [Salinimonas sediminis]|uniref:DMT family transporter n=1 Tax=Salinimonas sediminis TaxID=2303538 RepID=A0A346NMN4_9ALTE|nr:DMT family transporter [Salinimonas sediminis]AXR06791.1 DMT family transporter [Salinimonas sediminis]
MTHTHSASPLKISMLTAVAMLAFAANSLLCRMALIETDLQPASFTVIRLCSGAAMLLLLCSLRAKPVITGGSWRGAAALFLYAAGFSFAYTGMNTGTGALLLFGSVQLTMLSYSYYQQERFNRWQLAGFGLAVAGLVLLLLPSAASPALIPAILMIMAGMAWAAYTLLGKGTNAPLIMTTGNFWRSLPMLILLVWWLPGENWQHLDPTGVVYAIASGALASGAGYAVWYAVLPFLAASVAATIQLSVPVLAMLMGWLFLAESITGQMALAGAATLGGIALVIRYR